jgi:hypothetical protein
LKGINERKKKEKKPLKPTLNISCQGIPKWMDYNLKPQPNIVVQMMIIMLWILVDYFMIMLNSYKDQSITYN